MKEPRRAETRPTLPATERLKVTEVFHSIQGESTHAGRPCSFVRLTGCQMRCRWCDTAYSFYGGEWRSVDDIVEEVEAHGCLLVEVTGGEPLLQPGTSTLLARLCDLGHETLLETGGGVDISDVDPRVRRIVDVKCPGSGECEANHWPNLDLLRATDELKFVLLDQRDYLWARKLVRERDLASRCPVHFSPVYGELSPRRLAEWILRDGLPVRLQLQLHKFIWGAQRRGV